MDAIGAFLFLLGIAVAGGLIGGAINDDVWRADCKKMGFSRSGSEVYECKLKVETK